MRMADIQRQILPIPDVPRSGPITYDAKDPDTPFEPIRPLLPPEGAPNVVVIMLDDVGYGAPSAFGGPCRTPVFERLATDGLRFTRFHTTALCSPTRQALLTGRNHHSVGMGGVTEIATSAPGYNSLRPNTKAPIAEILRLNGYSTAGYSTAQFGKCHEVRLADQPGRRPGLGRDPRGDPRPAEGTRSRTAERRADHASSGDPRLGRDRTGAQARARPADGGLRRHARAHRPPHRPTPGSNGGVGHLRRHPRVRDHRDNGASAEGGLRGSFNEMLAFNGLAQVETPEHGNGNATTDRRPIMNGATLELAADYPLLNVFWTTMWVFLWILWFILLFRVIGDIFRDDEMSGWGKSGWTVFVVVLPYLGVFVYLIARGRGMGEREVKRAQQREQEVRTYIRESAGPTGHAEELSRLAELKNHGDLTSAEYEQAKAKVLAA